MRLLWVACALVACRGSTSTEDFTVFAAASLTESFTTLAEAFEARHPGVEVRLSFAGSHTLATQLLHGAPADVVASASVAPLTPMVQGGWLEPPRTFARNQLVLATPTDTPGASLEALPGLGQIVLGEATSPIGEYTEAALDQGEALYGEAWRRGVAASVVSREPSVRMVAAKVAMSEADVGLVYATDVVAVQGLEATLLPFPIAPPPTYVHARATQTRRPELAIAWMALVESAEGREALRARGFETP